MFKAFEEEVEKVIYPKLIEYLLVIMGFWLFYALLGRFFPIQFYILYWSNFVLEFFAYYGILIILAIFANIIILTILSYLKKKRNITVKGDAGLGLWDYFLLEPSLKKVFLLFVFLSVASLFEEIVFRYFIFQLCYLPFSFINPFLAVIVALIVSSAAFGIAHKSNGFFGYVINSSLSGIFFGLFFIRHGLFAAWILHFFWNIIIIGEYYLKLKSRQF